MKTKIYKVLSILLALAVVFSACVCILGTVSAKEAIYYIASNGADDKAGTEDDPLQTIAGVVFKARDKDGFTSAEDTVTVIIKDNDKVNWTNQYTKPGYTLDGNDNNDGHKFKLVITSKNGASLTTNSNDMILDGPVEFGKVKIDTATKTFRFNGNNVKFSADTTFDSSKIGATGISNSTSQATAQTVEINSYMGKNLMLGSVAGAITYSADINVIYNDADATAAQEISFGYFGGSAVTYNNNINFNVRAGDVLLKNYNTNTFKGAIQIIDASENGVKWDASTNGITAPKWIIKDSTGIDGAISFTTTAGKYNISVAAGTTLRVMKGSAIVKETTGGELDLTEFGAGTYEIAVKKPAKQATYYVSSGGSDSNGGTNDTDDALLTIDGVVLKALGNGFELGDTVTAIVKDDDAVAWTPSGTRPAQNVGGYKFNLIVKSENGATVTTNSNDMVLYGPTQFQNVNLSPAAGGFRFNDSSNAVIDENTTITLPDGRYFLLSHTADTVSSAVNVELKKFVNGKTFMLSSQNGGMTYDADINITYDDADATREQTIAFGFLNGASTTFKKNVNFNIKSGNSSSGAVKFNNDYPHSFDTNAAVQIINSSGTTLQGVDGIKATNKWIINNNTGDADIITFTSKAGKYNVKQGVTVCAMKDGKTVAKSENGVLSLSAAGEYTLGIAHDYTATEDTYKDYIYYGQELNGMPALNNFSAKVNEGVAVNVVYYGGSVTNGSNATVTNRDSWRGLISTWLETNTANAKVTNINSAYGGTGSHYGAYRVNDAVIAQNPDLLFVEYAINDYYDSATKAEALQRFETIIYSVRKALPECDIVTVLTTEKGLINKLKQGELHTQAQAHEQIAKAYGIPVIYVGKALANNLPDNFTDNDWAVYFKTGEKLDNVHPNNAGHRLYANVIQEFLANSLLGINKDTNTIVDHELPSTIVNDILLDGDVKLIPADKALSDQSKALGGSEFTRANEGGNGKLVGQDSYPHIATRFNMASDDTLKFKFTGTELSIFVNKDALAYKKVQVKIDGVQKDDATLTTLIPVVLAKGLENKEHEVEIKFAEGSGEQWVYGFYTRNEMAATHKNGHVYADDCTEKCTYCPYTRTAPHTQGTKWESDKDNHWKVCTATGCGAVIESTKTTHTPDHQGGATEEYPIKCTVCQYIMEQQLAHNHNYNQQNTAEQYKVSGATCTSPAIYNYSCSCGEEGTTTFEYGTTLPHSYDRMVATDTYKKDDATCTTQATYYYSCVCGKEGTEFFSSGELAQHNYVEEVVAPEYLKDDATCENYATYYKNCDGANCNATSPEHTFEDVAGGYGDHNAEHREETQTTQPCQAPGQIEHWVCMVCMSCFTDAACTQEVDPEDVWKMDEYTGAHSYKDGACEWCGAPENNSGIGGGTGDNTGGNTGDNAGGNTGDAGNTGNAGDTTIGSGTGNAGANTDSTENKTEEKTEDKVENKTEEKTEDKVSPQTSDVVNFTFLVALLFVSAFGVVYTSKKLKKSK